MSGNTTSRRRFIINCALVATALPLGTKLLDGRALAQDRPRLPLDNPQARALNYVETTEGLDHPSYKEGSVCTNCQFWTAGPDDAWGGCTLFPGYDVAGPGWCTAWAKKA
ncbi:MAG: high-potential iron-sulfur protein [Lysobacteraceae bacterium]|jgi:hypothetical protein